MATSVFILAALLLLSLPTATEQGTSSLTAILFPPALFAAVTSTAGCTAACAALAVAGLLAAVTSNYAMSMDTHAIVTQH
ncbi:hypothetical protein PRIPAC_92018 [Pristionchus pacificus]|uniref:Uncharacterized protein n=1 Tax=Pristionchus pacificus TaxID=54126 RepID=A0A2A6BAJ2_PRIPA|nr:hypothetical protein PRIPAC_92018 [Pristionchus pacificus]|eukprot:PDM62886.1 hypothetical protein PRIPAC_50101 [Pristionchus pacificus]